MYDIIRALGTFLIALAAGVSVEQTLVIVYGMDIVKAAGIGTAVLISVGLYLCNLGRKSKPPEA